MEASWAPVFVATAAAWTGVLVAAVVRRASPRIMRPLVYVPLLFLGLAAILDILPRSKAALSWPVFGAAVAGSYAAFWFIGKYVAPICPACAMQSLEHDHRHAHGRGLVILSMVLAVHCFLDGLGVSAASTVEASFGMRVFAAITVHKFPEGLAFGLMLIAGGRSTWPALAWAVGIETATLAGALAAALWAHPSEFWLALVLAHIGGTFLYLSISGLRDVVSGPRVAVAH